MPSLQDQIDAIATDWEAACEAEFGICVRPTAPDRSDELVTRNADTVFPLCSVFKIPVLVAAFQAIQAGALDLNQRIELTVEEKNLPSGVLVFFQDGLQPTLRDLLTLMIIISDNTATDMVMHRLEPDAATRAMHDLGLNEIHVPLTVRDIFTDLLESPDPTLPLHVHATQPRRLGGLSYSTGPENNVGTPRALTDLLVHIQRAQGLDPTICDQMLQILHAQQLNDRLPRYLPAGVRCAHKTGTLPGIRNDSGLIYAPARGGGEIPVAVTVFTRSVEALAVEAQMDGSLSKVPRQQMITERQRSIDIDHAIGLIGRAVWDWYVE